MAFDSLPPVTSSPPETGWIGDAPEWPVIPNNGRVVFLAESASRLERRLIKRWVESRRPGDVSADRAELVMLPPSRRRGRRRLGPELEATLAGGGDPLMAPLRVIWQGPLHESRRSSSALSLLTLGDPRDPNWLRQAWVLKRDPNRCLIVAGEPATASDLRARWTEAAGAEPSETLGFADFVAQTATLALERAERKIRGARYKVPRLVHEQILGRPSFRGGLARLVSEQRA